MAGDRGSLVGDLPLPEGPWALAELNLLAWALAGAWGGGLDGYVAIHDAQGKQPDLARDGLTHVIKKSGGTVVGEYWVIIRTDGRARHYDEYPVGGNLGDLDRYEIELDLDQSVASTRYRAILASLSHHLPSSEREIMGNPLLVTERATQHTACGVLQAARRMLAERYLEPVGREGQAAIDRIDGAAQDLLRFQQIHRNLLDIDANEASALLLAADVASAASADGELWRPGIYAEYIARASDQLATGRWENLGRVVAEAMNNGYRDALGRIADGYYEGAKRRRDAALDAPPQPLEFTRRLFNAAPYAAAAANLCKWVVSLAGPLPEWARRKTQTEELFVRIADGLSHQWLSWASGAQGGIPEERHRVEQARRRGDETEVRRLILAGEHSLRRPRSYRPFLFGERLLDATLWRELVQEGS